MNGLPDRLLSQGEVEHMITRLSDALEAETDLFANVCDQAAEREADYRRTWGVAMMAAANDSKLRNADARKAKVEVDSADALAVHLLADARKLAAREGLNSLRARLDALRTIAANIRNQVT